MKTGDIIINTECIKLKRNGEPNPLYCMIFLRNEFEKYICLSYEGKIIKIINNNQFEVKGHVDLLDIISRNSNNAWSTKED